MTSTLMRGNVSRAKKTEKAPRPRAGRPTREEAARRLDELLECALDIFLERGYEEATMVEIASAVGMSKRTVYAYYEDKADLFKAAVRRAITRYTVSREAIAAAATDDLETTLLAVARLRIANVSTATGIRLQRILNAQAYRFPELFSELFDEATRPTIDFLAELFDRLNDSGEVVVNDTQRAAVAFLSLVVSGPARIITSGNRLDEGEMEERIRFAVQLFLNGIRRR